MLPRFQPDHATTLLKLAEQVRERNEEWQVLREQMQTIERAIPKNCKCKPCDEKKAELKIV